MHGHGHAPMKHCRSNQASNQRRPRFGQKRGRGIVIEIDRRSGHRLPVWRMRAGHTIHAKTEAPSRLRIQTLLEI
jgi:hypothetical protein